MKSNRLKLINCDRAILEKALEGDEVLATFLNINIPEKWSVFGSSIFEYVLKEIKENPDTQQWMTYFPILKDSNTLIGTCGYKGIPNEEGMVEIGYEVAETYRNQGYATEMAQLLIEQAFEQATVKKVQAHTLAEENASVSVLKKCSFIFIEALEDPEDGSIWKWELVK